MDVKGGLSYIEFRKVGRRLYGIECFSLLRGSQSFSGGTGLVGPFLTAVRKALLFP